MTPPGVICYRDEEDPDGGCGCGRSFAGLFSAKATTAMVRERAGFTRDDYIEAFRSGLERQGWDTDVAVELAAALLDEAAHRPAGAVVEHRLGVIRQRG